MKIETNCLPKDFEVDCKVIEVSKVDAIREINNLPDEDPRDIETVKIENIETLDDCHESDFEKSETSGVLEDECPSVKSDKIRVDCQIEEIQ